MTTGAPVKIPESLFIGGAWHGGAEALQVVNPATSEVIAEIGYGDRSDAIAAVDAAAEAFPLWSSVTFRERADLLMRVYTALRDDADRIGLLLARECGKRLAEAVAEVRFAAEYFRWFAEQARRPSGHLLPHEVASRRHLTMSRPSGVAICLTPWNFPVSIQARKLAPALAAGCTIVARTSEKAPLAVIELFKIIEAAGFPRGVANLVQGPSAPLVEAMLAHSEVRVVSFTGSTEVGRLVMRLASERVVRPLLELGGDAPFIVFEDADIAQAVNGAMQAKFRNNGQSCIAANRFYVQDSIYDEFCRLFAKQIDAMTIGDPVADPSPDLGPVIDRERQATLVQMIKEAESAGARRLTASRDVPRRGFFVAPALFSGTPEDSALSCQEVFGPVAAITRFDTEQEVIARANASEMGLAAYVFTRSLDRAWHMSEGIAAGIIGINQSLPSVAFAPMGGVKQSGLGREGSSEGLQEFMDVRYVAIDL